MTEIAMIDPAALEPFLIERMIGTRGTQLPLNFDALFAYPVLLRAYIHNAYDENPDIMTVRGTLTTKIRSDSIVEEILVKPFYVWKPINGMACSFWGLDWLAYDGKLIKPTCAWLFPGSSFVFTPIDIFVIPRPF